MIVHYNGHVVSKQALEATSSMLGRMILVTSGDRDFVPKGGARQSDHLRHRAADFHVDRLPDQQAFEAIRAAAKTIFPQPMAFQVIRHGAFTQTQGAHIHLGHPEAGSRRIGFWTEGLTAGSRGRYDNVG